jgi:hypothetical protein
MSFMMIMNVDEVGKRNDQIEDKLDSRGARLLLNNGEGERVGGGLNKTMSGITHIDCRAHGSQNKSIDGIRG